MRVISGQVKGRRIKAPKGRAVRPTSDRVKEATFNILPHDLYGLKVLDLFAGSGSLSIEALSRGAEEAWLVEASRNSVKAIRENLAATGFDGKARVWTAPVTKAIRRLSGMGEKFDLIFLDPPYERDWIGKIIRLVAQGNLLRERGILVAEHSIKENVAEGYGPLALKDQRRYGATLLSFFGYL